MQNVVKCRWFALFLGCASIYGAALLGTITDAHAEFAGGEYADNWMACNRQYKADVTLCIQFYGFPESEDALDACFERADNAKKDCQTRVDEEHRRPRISDAVD